MQYEFALPPLEEQRRIAEVLRAAEKAIHRNRLTIDQLHTTRSALEIELIAKPLGLNRKSLYLKTAEPISDWALLNGQELLDNGHLVALQDGSLNS